MPLNKNILLLGALALIAGTILYLEKDKPILDELDRKIGKMKDQGIDRNRFHPLYSHYIELIIAREPYELLEGKKRRLEKSINGLKSLQIAFATTDRLLICSDTEDHSFTLRKVENNDWAVIDSLRSDQPHTVDPLQYLTERIKSFFLATRYCHYSFAFVRTGN